MLNHDLSREIRHAIDAFRVLVLSQMQVYGRHQIFSFSYIGLTHKTNVPVNYMPLPPPVGDKRGMVGDLIISLINVPSSGASQFCQMPFLPPLCRVGERKGI